MKYLYNLATILLLGFAAVSCTDDPLMETSTGTGEDFNIAEYSDGYSISFDITLDELGAGMSTRSDDSWDVILSEWESTLDPEEFRILFFDKDDQFLFESKTRWFAEIDSKNGNRAWRIGVPIFAYLSDSYDDNTTTTEDQNKDAPDYNWTRIVEIMRSEPFKIAVMANRPATVEIPTLSDYPLDNIVEGTSMTYQQIKDWYNEHEAKNGPFWNALNSVASDKDKQVEIKKVIDLHHCQFDPIYDGKSIKGDNGSVSNPKGDGWYDFIMNKNHSETDLIDGVEISNLPYMGAMSSWFSKSRKRGVGTGDDKRELRFYRLPHDRVDPDSHKLTDQNKPAGCAEITSEGTNVDPNNQYIPMYGIQLFDPLTTWNKGTTFNVSTQTASQTGEYDYKSIFLLRSVVKLELRIPMYDNDGNYVDIDNDWAQLMLNNYMARCEPMDVSTPTNEIWENDHVNNCEWKRIRDYGLLYDYQAGIGSSNHTFKQRLSWFYGVWKEQGWNFAEHGYTGVIPNTYESPHIFNPITQRTQYALITDCYLPIRHTDDRGEDIKKECFHRWVVYCGERNMNDWNTLGLVDTNGNRGYIAAFKIHVTKKPSKEATQIIQGYDKVYYFPITDYTDPNNPIYHKDDVLGSTYLSIDSDTESSKYYDPGSITNHWNTTASSSRDVGGYCWDVIKATKREHYPFPLLRNHFYRLTVAFGDDDNDINVQVMNSEKREVGGIFFN